MGRYGNTDLKKKVILGKEITHYGTTVYAKIPETDSDIWVITQMGDRLDLIAQQYYGDITLWWYIARVNNLKTMNIPAGTSLRIPLSAENAQGS